MSSPAENPAAAGSGEARAFPWAWTAGVMVVAALTRLVVALNTVAWDGNDSQGFRDVARMIATLDFSGYQGIRTPPYPLFLALVGGAPDNARLAQLALGVAITGLVFAATYHLAGSVPTAVASALLYALNLPQIYYESAVLSETLATFFIACAALLLVRFAGPERSRSGWVAAGIGLFAGLAALTRPLYVYLPVLFLLPVIVGVGVRRWRPIAACAVLGIAPLLAWSVFNYSTVGTLGPSTLPGYTLTTHTDAYVQDAPDEYAEIRDAYVRMRDSGSVPQAMAVWYVIPDLMEATGQSYGQLSKTFQKMNVQLIKSHPQLYARSVTEGALDFWKGQGRYDNPWVTQATLPGFSAVWVAWKYLTLAMNALFLLTVAVGAVVAIARRRVTPVAWVSGWLAAAVFAACALQALTEAASGARYGLPTQPLAWMVACVGALSAVRWLAGRASRTPRP